MASQRVSAPYDEIDWEVMRLQGHDASEQRLVKGREPKGITKEQIAQHNLNMARYYAAIKANRGFRDKYFASPENLIEAIDGYLECIKESGLFPTENGLMLYLDCTATWYYAVMQQMNDERADILKKYNSYVSEFLNQSGLIGGSNTIFSIYYLKSRMQQWDTPTEQTLNINFGASTFNGNPADVVRLVESTPVEVDYTEVDDT